MSLYNLMNGMNANLALIISCLVGYRIDERIPRFRNVFLEADDCDISGYDYLIYTRMGGGNYQCWNEDYDENCNCPYHQLLEIEKDPCFIGGYDDEFDETYRTLAFKFTDEQKKKFEEIKEKGLSVIEKEIKDMFPDVYEKIFNTMEYNINNIEENK